MSDEVTVQAARAAGFSAALVLPALTSTLRQAQREASPALHVLAGYAAAPNRPEAPPPLSAEQDSAAACVAAILTEQAINGPLFFFAVRALVLAFGPIGGMLGQVAITANTMANPENHQTLNPGRVVVGGWATGMALCPR